MLQEFVDEINNAARRNIENIHTAVPAVIRSYDPEKNLAVVLPKAKYIKPDGSRIDYPVISGVPVSFSQSTGAKATIASPIKEGDECFLVFAETALDYWMYGSDTDTELHFDLTNAIAVPNISAKGNDAMKLACDEDASVIKVDNTLFKVKKDGVLISGTLAENIVFDNSGLTATVKPNCFEVNKKMIVGGDLVVGGAIIYDGEIETGSGGAGITSDDVGSMLDEVFPESGSGGSGGAGITSDDVGTMLSDVFG